MLVLFAVFTLYSCDLFGPPRPKATVSFNDSHSSPITVSWGNYTPTGITEEAGYSAAGSLELQAGEMKKVPIAAGTAYNIWYLEGTVYHILILSGDTAAFTFLEGTDYSITFNANYTYTYSEGGSAATTPPGGDSSTPVTPTEVIKPAIVNTSVDTEAANFEVVKGNCWYLPDSQKLYIAILLRNNNAISISLLAGHWMVVLRDASGKILYAKMDLLYVSSTTPTIYTNSLEVFPFDVAAGEEMYLYPIPCIQIGNADTSFTPDQIARIDISAALAPSNFDTVEQFIPPERQIQLTDFTVLSDHVEASLVNGSSGIAYDTFCVHLLAVDASGKYVGITQLLDSLGGYISVIAAGQSVTAYCFAGDPCLSMISTVELVPFVTYESGASLLTAGMRTVYSGVEARAKDKVVRDTARSRSP